MFTRTVATTRLHLVQRSGLVQGRGRRAFSDPCWSCGHKVTSSTLATFVPLACDACGIIQPVPKGASLFALLGVEPAIVLDLADLEAKFRHRQRSLHPDLYTLKSPREQELSAAASAAVNMAYQTLKKPMSRLRYVLELEGNAVLSEDAGGGGKISDPSFLMEIMDLRETIESCTSQADLKLIGVRNQERIQSALGLVEKHYAAQDIDALASEAVKLQYFTKIEEEIEEARNSEFCS